MMDLEKRPKIGFYTGGWTGKEKKKEKKKEVWLISRLDTLSEVEKKYKSWAVVQLGLGQVEALVGEPVAIDKRM